MGRCEKSLTIFDDNNYAPKVINCNSMGYYLSFCISQGAYVLVGYNQKKPRSSVCWTNLLDGSLDAASVSLYHRIALGDGQDMTEYQDSQR